MLLFLLLTAQAFCADYYVATNRLDPSGNDAFTNSLRPDLPRQFYRLNLP